MTGRAVALVALTLLGVTGSCDSLVSGRCASGWDKTGGACVRIGTEPDGGLAPDGGGPDGGGPDGGRPRPDAGVDAGTPDAGVLDASVPDAGATPDADTTPDAGTEPDASTLPDAGTEPDATLPPDALVCTAPTELCGDTCVDVLHDPDNCGACGRECPSGICDDGACVGSLPGHVVAIGHDFVEHTDASARLLGNAFALAGTDPIVVGEYRGSASAASRTAVHAAATAGLVAQGRTWTSLNVDASLSRLDEVDVVLVHAQRGAAGADFALGASWGPALEAFLARGGVVVALEGASGTSHAILGGAGLLPIASITTLPASDLSLTAPADALAPGVLSPYRSGATSVVFDGPLADVVISDATGRPVVMHATVP